MGIVERAERPEESEIGNKGSGVTLLERWQSASAMRAACTWPPHIMDAHQIAPPRIGGGTVWRADAQAGGFLQGWPVTRFREAAIRKAVSGSLVFP